MNRTVGGEARGKSRGRYIKKAGGGVSSHTIWVDRVSEAIKPSLRGGAEVLDRLRREHSTRLAQSVAVASEGMTYPIENWCARLESNQRPSA